MTMIDTLRTLIGIRKQRRLPPAGAQPATGSNIARNAIRIQLKYPITSEQWLWFTEKGWRKIDLRTDRRQYMKIPDHLVERLILADDPEEREMLYERVLQAVAKKVASRKQS